MSRENLLKEKIYRNPWTNFYIKCHCEEQSDEAILNKVESIPRFGVLIKQETLAPHASAGVASPQNGSQ